MRREHILSAVAIIVLLTSIVPQAAATSSLSVAILSPGEGGTLVEDGLVTLRAQGGSPGAKTLAGNLLLDGAWAGSFTNVPFNATNGTTFSVRLRGSGFASGDHVLTARVFSDADAPVDAAPVEVALDLAPRIEVLAASYDVATRELVADVRVEDEAPVAVRLADGTNATNTTFHGAQTMRLHVDRAPGPRQAVVSANDARGQRSNVTFAYEVPDQPGDIQLQGATYVGDGRVIVELVASDPDGVRHVIATSAVGDGGRFGLEGTSWEGNLTMLVDPRLGTYTANATAYDRFDTPTRASFVFSIGGEREVVLERVVHTDDGVHADRAAILLPRVAAAILEICVDTCDDAPPAPVGTGQLQPCAAQEPAASGNLVAWGAWYAGQVADRGDLFVPTKQPSPTGSWPLPRVATGIAPGWCAAAATASEAGDAVAIVARGLRNGTSSAPDCVATSPGRTACAFDARLSASTLDLTWLQGPDHRVVVRVVGVRV